jgi:hypothetical protein
MYVGVGVLTGTLVRDELPYSLGIRCRQHFFSQTSGVMYRHHGVIYLNKVFLGEGHLRFSQRRLWREQSSGSNAMYFGKACCFGGTSSPSSESMTLAACFLLVYCFVYSSALNN